MSPKRRTRPKTISLTQWVKKIVVPLKIKQCYVALVCVDGSYDLEIETVPHDTIGAIYKTGHKRIQLGLAKQARLQNMLWRQGIKVYVDREVWENEGYPDSMLTRYQALVTRDATESTYIYVRAVSKEQAAQKALDIANDTSRHLRWELDEGNIHKAYFGDEDNDIKEMQPPKLAKATMCVRFTYDPASVDASQVARELHNVLEQIPKTDGDTFSGESIDVVWLPRGFAHMEPPNIVEVPPANKPKRKR